MTRKQPVLFSENVGDPEPEYHDPSDQGDNYMEFYTESTNEIQSNGNVQHAVIGGVEYALADV